jgi:hypothetical protein
MPNEKNFSDSPYPMSYTSRQQLNAKKGEAREKQIREMPAAELEAFCLPNELAGERNRRWYYGQMNQKELEFQATYEPWAAVELKRRNGELPR